MNPLKHIDLFGMIVPFIIFLCGFKFLIGWAKPVPVNFCKLTPRKKGIFCVCIAGVMVNFILAAVSLIVLRIIRNGLDNNIVKILIYIYLINLLLGIFNLIPITPLDGGRIVYFFSSGKIKKVYDFIEKYGVVIIIMIAYFVNEYFSDKILIMFDFFLKLTGTNLGL